MNTYSRRIMRWSLLIVSASAVINPVEAQQVAVQPLAIGQMVNEVLDSLLPSAGPTRSVFWKRGVFFDRQRTLAAFLQSPLVPLSSLQLRHSMKEGSKTMLDDCDEFARKSCRQLEWGVYVYLEPIAIGETQARVRAHLLYADRETPYVSGAVPQGNGKLTGSSAVVYLTRAKGAAWKYLRTGAINVY
jgi:hypothetical protein